MPRITTIHTPAEIKNYAINGAFDFWQEKVGNTTTVSAQTTHSGYMADMFAVNASGATSKSFTYVRSTDVPTFQQAGFAATYSGLFTNTTGISLVAADLIQPFQYIMEGYDYAKLHGKAITVGFWFKASIAGTYSIAFRNAAVNRSYVTTFTASANTWEFKSVSLTLDNQGTWAFDNSQGLYITIAGNTGSTYQTSTLNAWQTGNFVSTNTATTWANTSGATIRMALFSITEGSFGFGATGFQRAGKTLQQELAMCQRYYEKSYQLSDAPAASTNVGTHGIRGITGAPWLISKFSVEKRVAPSITYYDWVGNINKVRFNGTDNSALNGSLSIGSSGFSLISSTSVSEAFYQWVADSRL